MITMVMTIVIVVKIEIELIFVIGIATVIEIEIMVIITGSQLTFSLFASFLIIQLLTYFELISNDAKLFCNFQKSD